MRKRLAFRRSRVMPGAASRRTARGQSLVEFVLLFPVLLLIVLGGIDLGRIYLGWIALNNSARIAANYAASNALQVSSGNAAALASYQATVQRDTAATNCDPGNTVPAPVYSPDAKIGSTATVTLTCQFDVLTPIIGSIVGGKVKVSASSSFPVRTGIVANGSSGGSSGPVASFTVSTTSGDAPLSVTFTDTSTGNPATWSWDFDNGDTSTDQNPAPVLYSTPGTYVVTLSVSDGLNGSTATKTITVTTPPGPVANFSMTPPSGTTPLTVNFADTSTGNVVAWAWNLGNGATPTVKNPPTQVYTTGTYTITLKVTDQFNQSSTATKTLVVTNVVQNCKVPDFKNDTTSNATITKWTTAGFVAGNIVFNPARPPEFQIKNQTLTKNSMQPCATATITVSK